MGTTHQMETENNKPNQQLTTQEQKIYINFVLLAYFGEVVWEHECSTVVRFKDMETAQKASHEFTRYGYRNHIRAGNRTNAGYINVEHKSIRD